MSTTPGLNVQRYKVGQRMSQAVVYNGFVFLAGQVGDGATVADQTRSCLERVDALLAEAGTSRDRILQATIWLADIKDFDEMNAVWDAWVPEGQAPARACGEAKLARDDLRVEVIVTAAL
jgi:enamine deaminase RidA (YjgF/YER057c/UK114 family)